VMWLICSTAAFLSDFIFFFADLAVIMSNSFQGLELIATHAVATD
jgi:hypothetical protein